MKIIRRLEDLNGLENGKGLKLNWYIYVCEDGRTDFINILANNKCFYSVPFSDVDDEFFKTLKAMGFEFEWKPKRTLEEVLHSYSTMFFVPNEKNYLILEKDGRYSVSYSFCKSIGTSYYLKKDAEKICEELNS